MPGGRAYTTRLKEPIMPLEELPLDFEALENQGRAGHDQAAEDDCLPASPGLPSSFHPELFQRQEATAGCNVCDNCLSRSTVAPRMPTEEETVIIQKALSCVGRMNGRFGRGRVTRHSWVAFERCARCRPGPPFYLWALGRGRR